MRNKPLKRFVVGLGGMLLILMLNDVILFKTQISNAASNYSLDYGSASAWRTCSVMNSKPGPSTLNSATSTTPSPMATVTATATASSTSNSQVLLVGRFDTSVSVGPRFAWSASTIKANFRGTGIAVNLKSTGANWFNVIIDDVVRTPVNITPGTEMPVTLAAGLVAGNHQIELVKRTEAWLGEVQFLGFTVADGNLLPPPGAAGRRIELIGDSITCGYGNEGTSQYQNFTPENENADRAYGAIAARTLGADQITIAWSGKGLIRNYDGATTGTLPDLYLQILPYNSSVTWNTGQWIPQVVVINLGTNDFNTGIPDENTFITTYSNFVKRIRAQYHDAHIYCALGPMLSGAKLLSARNFICKVVEKFRAESDIKIHFIEFPIQNGTLGYGEDWHPSVATHTRMAQQLVKQIKTDLGW